MTFNKLCSQIAKIEGKKSQARIGDIREILSILIKMDAEHLREYPLNFNNPLEYLARRSQAKLTQMVKTKKAKKK